MQPLQAINDANFVVARLNLEGITQPTIGEKQAFVDETTLDVVANPMHKAADRPHLTMNDKIFAARYGIVNLTPVAAETPLSEVEVPDDSWEKSAIVDWLSEHGVELEDDAEIMLSKEELLSLVQDVLDSP